MLRRQAGPLLLLVLTSVWVQTNANANVGVLTIRGTVRDPWGMPAAGAVVSDGLRAVVADTSGAYAIQETQWGCYWVEAYAKGAFDDKDVCLRPPNLEASQDFAMLYDAFQATASPYYVSTAAGPSDTVFRFATHAQHPGSPGMAGSTCAYLVDTRTNISTLMDLIHEGDVSQYEATVPVASSSLDGTYSFTGTIRECSTGAPMSIPARANYAVDGTPPIITNLTSHWTGSDARVKVSIRDPIGFDDQQTVLLVDSVEPSSPPSLTCGRDCILEGGFSDLAAGPHSLHVEATDLAGNKAIFDDSFSVDAAGPSFGIGMPSGTITTRSPTIHIHVTDTESGIDGATASMVLSDGLRSDDVEAAYDAASGDIAFSVPSSPTGIALGEAPLVDGTYTVSASVRDKAGNERQATWFFTVRTLPLGQML